MLCRVLSCVALLFVATAAHADTWIGRPTVGDIVRRDIGDLMLAQQDLVRSKAEYNAQIGKARERFFATAKNPLIRGKSSQEFARLLLGKDMYYLSNFLTNGIGEPEVQNAQMLNALTGGEIDNGIPPTAADAFALWVNEVRLSLGARSRSGMLVVTDPDKLLNALEANLDSYEAYRVRRDRAEFAQRGFMVKEDPPVKLAADGGLAVGRQGFSDKDRMLYFYTSGSASEALRLSLESAQKSGQQILECRYGREDRPEVYYFWHKTLPANMEQMRAQDRPLGMLASLGTKSWDNCPASSRQANAEYHAGQASRIPMNEEIEAERQAEIKANREKLMESLDRNKAVRSGQAAPAARTAQQTRDYMDAMRAFRKRQGVQLHEFSQSLRAQNISGAPASAALAEFRKKQREEYAAYREKLSAGDAGTN